MPKEAAFAIKNIDSKRGIINFICSNMELSDEDRQSLLEAPGLLARARKALEILVREQQLAELKNSLQEKVKQEIDQQQKEYFKKFIETYKEGAFIISFDGDDIGFYNGCATENDYEIGNICIVPEYQNRGIGTAVLKDVLAENAGKKITLQYFKQNPVGRLYERLGFKVNGETQFHYQMVKEK